MVRTEKTLARRVRSAGLALVAFAATLPLAGVARADVGAVAVNVVSPVKAGDTTTPQPIRVGFRWLLEEDSTWPVQPGVPSNDTLALNMHKSHMTVVAQGHSDGATASVPVPDTTKRYFLSILPDHDADGNGAYTQSGRQVTPELLAAGTPLTITLPAQPTPTAQIFARAFQDSAPINGTWDDAEQPLEGFPVFIYDMGGQLNTDTFGNPLGTVYEGVEADGTTPHVKHLGDGSLHTMTAAEVNDPERNPYGLAVGEVLVKNIAPGKYGMQIVPKEGLGWVQTSTIEGTPGLDNWVKANEPRYFAEFGPAGHHSEFGFVNPDPAKNDFPKPNDPEYPFGGSHTLSGRVVNMHMARPPDYSFYPGHPLAGCWVGLNDATGTRGLFTAPCDGDANFSIPDLKAGDYQLVFFDRYLDNIIGFQMVTVGNGDLALGDVPVFRWFGAHEHWVFNDLNGNGQRDAGEAGIPDALINLRYRDGSIYGSSTTDTTGYLPFDEIFPFFSWLVAEVDFSRYKATGVTIAVDGGGRIDSELTGGEVPSTDRPGNIGHGHLSPQAQDCANGGTNPDATSGACQTRTEVAQWDAANPDAIVAPPLLEGYNGFLGTTDVFEWGKQAYPAGENGGITGVVYYTTTRAENDPRFATAETWEPGIPRVALALYRANADGVIYHKDPATGARGALSGPSGDGVAPVLADVDNYPLGWSDGTAPKGAEDIDHDGDGQFDLGDALEVAHTDSWDDNLPTNCPGDPNDAFHQPQDTGAEPRFDGKCYDGLRNYSQVRPAVFDGGYAFGRPFTPLVLDPGYYVVQANAPRGFDGAETYQVQQEEDKNVDFGDAMRVSPQALPPICVGGPGTTGTPFHHVDAELALFPGVGTDPRYAGDRPGCDFRLVNVSDGKNAASDFFMFTETPITGHIQGFVLNDLANEFNPNSPNFGEKMAPSWIPVSVRDWAGNEVYHTYTDQWGTYNAIVPTAYRINTPMPSGVSPNMLQVCLNAPTYQDAGGAWVPEPHHNRQFTQFCYTLDFKPGQTTYLDTPVLPIAAFVGPDNWQLDCEYPSGTPVINYADAGGNGPYISAAGSRTLVVHSMGTVMVADPLAARVDSTTTGANNQVKVARDFGFGGAGTVWIGSLQVPAANVTWTNEQLTITVPAGARTGQLRIRRTDTGIETVVGLTVTIDQAGQPASVVRPVLAGQLIQDVVDKANAGDLVMVRPGLYMENVVITKPIRLQGWGAGAVTINPVQSPTERIALWREKLNKMANCDHVIGLLPGQANNTPAANQPCGFTPGSGLFLNEEGAGVLVAPVQGAFARGSSRIDGFTVTGSDQAGGILVNAYATGLEISNNIVVNNQGPYAAGIRAGQPLLLDADDNPVNAENVGLRIHHNHVAENGGLFEAGAGIGLYTGSDRYQVSRNYVCGNFAAGDGGGIAHWGNSPGGVITDNQVLFNQAFDQTVGAGGDGGGIYVAGYAPIAGGQTPGVGGTGANAITVARNTIVGNNAGSGNGGGIALEFLGGGGGGNGNNNVVNVTSNIIANNVAGWLAGGVWMDDATPVSIWNNTIVNNDSTATAANAFGPSAGSQVACAFVASARSCPQTAGVHASGGTMGSGDFRNNIILGNRAFHVELAPADGTHLAPYFHQAADGFADLGGTALYTGGQLTNPNGIRNSLLGSSNALVPGAPPAYCSLAARNNACADPTAVEPNLFVRSYANGAPAFATDGSTAYPPEGTTLSSLAATPAVAAATDEGGNFIDMHYGPLSRVVAMNGAAEVLSDYHLKSTADANTLAIDRGTNTGAPSYDVDGQSRPVQGRTGGGQTTDRGADEFGSTGLAASPPTIQPIPQQAVLASTTTAANVFTYQAVAQDANGDQLRYRIVTTSGAAAPAALGINDSGQISWSPVVTWPNNGFPATAGCSGNGNTQRTCSYLVQVTDAGAFGAGATCLPTNCASTTLTITLRRSQGLPTAVNNTFGGPGPNGNSGLTVNTMGIYTLAAPGVLGNDTNPNGNQFPLQARLVADGTTAAGQLTLGADGSVQFIANSDWVGTTSFTYQASNDGINWSNTATVQLRRDIAVTSARYINGAWVFTGRGATPGRRIQIVRERGPGNPNARSITPTQVNQRPLVGNTGDWSYTRQGGPSYLANDTVTVSATNNNGQAQFSLAGVVVYSGAAADVHNSIYVQCPGDTNGNGRRDPGEPWPANQRCEHLAAGDGFSVMGDGTELYTFGFNRVTGLSPEEAGAVGILNAQWPAPTLEFKQGEDVYLTLTNVGMLKRPDLFDPHSVHFHGFPNAASVFDGVPEASIAINMGFSLTYYYRPMDPGTYLYHCHVEAAEHMQMGMLGNLYVRPQQDGTSYSFGGRTFSRFVYNDRDGSTGYDVEVPLQIGSFDSVFHTEHLGVQPLPFAEMRDDYPMLNGRGFPDTVNPGEVGVAGGGEKETSGVRSAATSSQVMNSIVRATQGQKILLRISDVSVTQFYTLGTTGGLQMQVVGTGAHILRGPGDTAADNLYYKTTSVTLGGGETADVLIDTSNVARGTYMLYATNLNELSNGPQDFGGLMTTIVIE